MKKQYKIIAALLMIVFAIVAIYLVLYRNMNIAAIFYLGALLVYFFVTNQMAKNKKE